MMTQPSGAGSAGEEKIEEVDIEVEKGKIGKTEEYRYLGNWISERGNVEKQLLEVKSKAKGMVAEAKRIGNERHTGRMSTEVHLLMYEKTIIPAILYNLEVWKVESKFKQNL